MSQTMNQKTASKKNKKNKKRVKTQARKPNSVAPPEEETEEEVLTFGDKLLHAVTPHLTTIIFAMIAGFLGFAAIAFIIRGQSDKKAMEWRELSNATSIANRTGEISGWKQVAETYPEATAGLWASQMAGDQQLRMGLEQITYNRDSGMGMIKKSKEFFQSVLDGPATAQTPMLKQASHFSMAYAHESLGEFAEAKVLYDKLLSDAPDSAFAEHARRGSARSGSEDYVVLYDKFDTWDEDVIGTAPGPQVPERPSIDFPEVDLPAGDKPPAESPTIPGAASGSSDKAAATPETSQDDSDNK